jgi:hypothetical protein
VELFTLDRNFVKQKEIDKFTSVIWTERYYGDSDITLVVPATPDLIAALPQGVFVGLIGSNELMLIDTIDIEGGQLKVTGQGLLPFLNNRFIRTTPDPTAKYWNIDGTQAYMTVGWVLWALVYYFVTNAASQNTGIPNMAQFSIPNLGLKGYDNSGSPIAAAIPFGPVYDAMRTIATTYEMGIRITWEPTASAQNQLLFQAYKGIDRTTAQSVNAIVRFSPQMDTLTGIKELQSISNYKTQVYSFCPPNPDGLAPYPGSAVIAGPTGFDLRAELTFEEDLTTDMVGGDPNVMQNVLNQRATQALNSARAIKAVDGTIVPLHQFQYGNDYSLGDIIEVQGNSGVVQRSRITEYIRSQDSSGEKAFPTVAMLD